MLRYHVDDNCCTWLCGALFNIFESLIILKIDRNKENCHKDGIATICSKIMAQSRRVTYLDPRDCEINSNTSVGQVDSN